MREIFGARAGLRRRSVAALAALLVLTSGAAAAAKPKRETKDEAARTVEQKAMQVYIAGDAASARQALERVVKGCRTACTAKTRAHLHVNLGTVKGVGEGDYAAAEREFTTALRLDPNARVTPALSNAELNAAFDRARAATEGEDPGPEEKPPPEEDKPLSVRELLHPEDNGAQRTEKKPPPPPPPRDAGPELRWNFFSARAIVDFAYLSDANICSPKAPSAYFCTDEAGARYAGRPQPNDEFSPGFAMANTRLVLGYERLLFAGLTAGAFAGYAFSFAKTPEGRSGGFPLHLEARATYTFGSAPFNVEGGDRLSPFVFLSLGAAEYDSHVIIRVNEIPCGARISPACKRDLDVHRRVGGIFTTLGGGARLRLDGPHALRAAVRATVLLGEGAFVVSPEIAYELGI